MMRNHIGAMPCNQHKQRTFDRSVALLPQSSFAVNRHCCGRYGAWFRGTVDVRYRPKCDIQIPARYLRLGT